MTKCKLLYAICGLCLFIACQQKPRERLNLIPQVDSICVGNGYFQIQALKTIQIPAKWEKVGKLFIKDLSEKSSIFIQLTNQNANIKIIENPSLPAEAYQLNIKKDFIQICKMFDLILKSNNLFAFFILECTHERHDRI